MSDALDSYADQEPDGALIADVLAGRSERFAPIVRRYWRALMRMAESRLGCADLAEDVVQETMMCAFKSLQSYDSRYSFRTWLWTIMLNQCRRHYRKKILRDERTPCRPTTDLFDLASADASSPVEQLLVKERAMLLQRMLDDLPEVQADALRLRFFGGLKFQEIADAMDCGLSTAKHRVKEGLLKISRHLATANLGDLR